MSITESMYVLICVFLLSYTYSGYNTRFMKYLDQSSCGNDANIQWMKNVQKRAVHQKVFYSELIYLLFYM